MEEALVVKNLKTQFFIYDGVVKALEDVTFTLNKGEVLGIVGETGCGKSVTAFSIMRLIPDPPGRIISGQIRMGNYDLMRGIDQEAEIILKKRPKIKHHNNVIKKNEHFYNKIRGRYISMIFQEPMAALNPVYTVEDQIIESIYLHSMTKILKVIKSASEHLPDLKSFRESGEIGAEFNDEVGTELSKIKNLKKGKDSVEKHLDMLIDEATKFSEKKEKYEELLKHSIEIDDLEEKLLGEVGEQERDSIISVLTKEAKKTKLNRLTKKLKKKNPDPIVSEARREALALLESVNIPNAFQILKNYPHELSGGMLQRVVIAIALSNDPQILIADEPTTALDVTIQAQILELLRDLKKNRGTSIILITHDLGVIAEMADRVVVMYAGNVVETAPSLELYHNPKHPYTIGLLQSIPRVDDPTKKLNIIRGTVPNLITPPAGCRFNPRCQFAFDRCLVEVPPTIETSEGHTVACHLFTGKEVR
ncbi:MAG: ATP-binding cassette domain-containing protein [Candidatus Thermoplasmatota archaeon]|jgi:peptide/nickel transport system ATP-binding protein|nr:ATP-binding cassette domain-containing protein [Candidatus Thermoplasmatota archaeon]